MNVQNAQKRGPTASKHSSYRWLSLAPTGPDHGFDRLYPIVQEPPPYCEDQLESPWVVQSPHQAAYNWLTISGRPQTVSQMVLQTEAEQRGDCM